jgi:Xaa-Pro aminopeptidase
MSVATITSQAALRTRDLERRRDAVREKMREAGLDVVICYGSGLHSFVAMNPAWYVSGFKQMGRHLAVILPLESDLTMIMTPPWDAARAKERVVTIANVVSTDDDRFLETVGAELGRHGLLGKRTAIAGGERTEVAGGGGQARSMSEAWASVLGGPPESAEKMLSDIAKVRDEWSLYCTRQAVGIAEEGYARLLETARPGMPEHEVAGLLETYMRELGAEDNFQLMSASQHNRLVHQPTNRILEMGDILLGEITPAVEGEFIQICRTAVIGKPTDLQREKFAMLDTALRAGMRAATPGTPVKEVVEAINKPIAEAGYEKYTKPPYMRTRGHSMSLGSMEPEIASDRDHVLQKGMVFVMHPNQYIPDTGYMMCGEPVIITDNGAEPLTSRIGTLDTIDWR